MDTIKTYLDSLFVNVEQTEETIQLKNDLLAHMEDRYHELLEEGKNEHEAIGAVISEFGSIDELLEEIDLRKAESFAEEPTVETAYQEYQKEFSDEPREVIGLSDFHDYVRERKKAAVMIGTGVFSVLMAIFSEVFFNGVMYDVSGVGNALFFIFVAIAVGLFIYGGMTFSRAKNQLNDLFITREVQQAAHIEQEAFARSFTFCIILGVMACILSVAPAALTYGSTVGEALMFPIVGCGVFLFIYGGVVKATFSKFLNRDVFVDEENIGRNALTRSQDKEYYQKKHWFGKIFWPIVVVIYFIFSFCYGTWAFSWVIFVIAGIFEEAFESYFKNRKYKY